MQLQFRHSTWSSPVIQELLNVYVSDIKYSFGFGTTAHLLLEGFNYIFQANFTRLNTTQLRIIYDIRRFCSDGTFKI